MYFDSLQAVLVMDGHGVFVWSAYAITVLVLLAAMLVPVRRRRRLLQEIAGEQRRASAAAAPRTGDPSPAQEGR